MADISTQVKIPAELLFQILISSFCDQTTKTFSLLIWLSKWYFLKCFLYQHLQKLKFQYISFSKLLSCLVCFLKDAKKCQSNNPKVSQKHNSTILYFYFLKTYLLPKCYIFKPNGCILPLKCNGVSLLNLTLLLKNLYLLGKQYDYAKPRFMLNITSLQITKWLVSIALRIFNT